MYGVLCPFGRLSQYGFCFWGSTGCKLDKAAQPCAQFTVSKGRSDVLTPGNASKSRPGCAKLSGHDKASDSIDDGPGMTHFSWLCFASLLIAPSSRALPGALGIWIAGNGF